MILPWPVLFRACGLYFLKSYSKYFYSRGILIGMYIQKQTDSTVADYKNHILKKRASRRRITLNHHFPLVSVTSDFSICALGTAGKHFPGQGL